LRLETRAGEFTAVASLRGTNPEGVGKPTARNQYLCYLLHSD